MDALALLAKRIVVVLVQVHYFLEIVLAFLNALNKCSVRCSGIFAYILLNRFFCLVGLADQVIDFQQQSSLLFLHLFAGLLYF